MALKNHTQKNIDMTQGSIYKLLLSFAIPLLLGDLFQQLYNTADTWVIGNFASNDEYAAVGACTHILNMIIKTFIGLSSGVGIIIARSFGEGDREKVKRSASTAFVITIICSVLFTALGLLAVPIALRISGVPESIFEYAEAYLNIIFSLVSAQVIYNMGAAILRAVGDSQKPFLFLVVAAIINVVLDLYFVIKLNMGIQGVAWATAIAQCVAAVLVVIELCTTKLDVRLDKKNFCFDKKIHRDMIVLGIPTALQMSLTAISNVFIQSYINGLGVDFLSGFSTFNKTEQILFMAGNSMGVACMTFVSQNLGANNHERARKGVRASNVITVLYAGTLILLTVIFAPQISYFFNQDPLVVECSTICLRYMTPFVIFQDINQVLMGAIRGTGNTKLPLVMQVSFNVGYRQLAMAVIKVLFYNPLGICIANATSWMCLFIAMNIVYSRSGLAKKLQTFDIEKQM